MTIVEIEGIATEQRPLPDPDALPAWVKQALSEYTTQSGVLYLGYDTVMRDYEELWNSSSNLEKMTLRKLRKLAMLWQRSNYRTYVTQLEKQLLEFERDALTHPYATRKQAVQVRELNSYGEWITTDSMEDRLDMAFVLSHIQKRLASIRVSMGVQHIKHTLEAVTNIYLVCDLLGVSVATVQSHQQGKRTCKAA
jgi:hypothetical protein